MPPLHLLIKPASGRCNMRCRYCFYADEVQHRASGDCGLMDDETFETLVRKALETAEGECTFAFQGGEPTLRGIGFFERAVVQQKKSNVQGLKIHNAIQTNGLLLDEAWAEFFAREKFLVGLSIDGPSGIHNKNRVDSKGEGTLRRALEAAELLKRHKVDFNVLTVVTDDTASRVEPIYDFFMDKGLCWQQYIPCLDPLGEAAGWLSSEGYACFLIGLFDRWSRDVLGGRFVYIRQFENYVGLLLGKAAEACGMMGQCMLQYVVEADGSVYPCDFYALDAYRLGNVRTDTFGALDAKRSEQGFIENSIQKDAECRACKYHPLCRGGCRRDREADEGLGRTRFCAAYKAFFAHALPILERIAARCE